MLFSAPAEDYLERLYMRDMEQEAEPEAPEAAVLEELLRHHCVLRQDDHLTLTRDGKQQGAYAVRRHRLAERLLQDVMAVHGRQVDEAACEFEHSLHHGVDEHICTLLGHPTTCPHGRPIPPGRCCRERKGSSSPAIAQLADMKDGEHGAIAYLSSSQAEIVQKLMALGALPGSPLWVIQTFPSFVFQVGQTQIAVDKALASDIYVRRATETSPEKK